MADTRAGLSPLGRPLRDVLGQAVRYDRLRNRVFAALYDLLNSGVESRVAPYRRQSAGLSRGRILEIGGGTGANLSFYQPGANVHMVEPNPHMIRRFMNTAGDQGRPVKVVSGIGERLPFADSTFDCVVTTLTL